MNKCDEQNKERKKKKSIERDVYDQRKNNNKF